MSQVAKRQRQFLLFHLGVKALIAAVVIKPSVQLQLGARQAGHLMHFVNGKIIFAAVN